MLLPTKKRKLNPDTKDLQIRNDLISDSIRSYDEMTNALLIEIEESCPIEEVW